MSFPRIVEGIDTVQLAGVDDALRKYTIAWPSPGIGFHPPLVELGAEPSVQGLHQRPTVRLMSAII
jgi:hypothetical protein